MEIQENWFPNFLYSNLNNETVYVNNNNNNNFSTNLLNFQSILENNNAEKIITELHQIIERIKYKSEKKFQKQKGIKLPLDPGFYFFTSIFYTQSKEECNRILLQFHSLFSTTFLSPKQIQTIISIRSEIDQLLIKLDLAIQELEFFLIQVESPYKNKLFCKLAITKNVFTKAIKKHQNITTENYPFEVKLFTSPNSKCIPISNVTAKVKLLEISRGMKTIGLSNNIQPMNDGIAYFRDLQFNESSNMKKVCIEFELGIKYLSDRNFQMENIDILVSNTTSEFIVFGNENQWQKAERQIIREHVYKGKNEVNFIPLANDLQIHFLNSMNLLNSANENIRGLSLHDFKFLNERFFMNNNVVSRHHFEIFWEEYFSKVWHNLRFNRAFSSLWADGTIIGFYSRDEIEEIIKKKAEGTFLYSFGASKEFAGKLILSTYAYLPYNIVLDHVPGKHKQTKDQFIQHLPMLRSALLKKFQFDDLDLEAGLKLVRKEEISWIRSHLRSSDPMINSSDYLKKLQEAFHNLTLNHLHKSM